MPTPSDPTAGPSGQASSDVSGDPKSLAREASASRAKFEELQGFLNNTLETPGGRVCHEKGKA